MRDNYRYITGKLNGERCEIDIYDLRSLANISGVRYISYKGFDDDSGYLEYSRGSNHHARVLGKNRRDAVVKFLVNEKGACLVIKTENDSYTVEEEPAPGSDYGIKWIERLGIWYGNPEDDEDRTVIAINMNKGHEYMQVFSPLFTTVAILKWMELRKERS